MSKEEAAAIAGKADKGEPEKDVEAGLSQDAGAFGVSPAKLNDLNEVRVLEQCVRGTLPLSTISLHGHVGTPSRTPGAAGCPTRYRSASGTALGLSGRCGPARPQQLGLLGYNCGMLQNALFHPCCFLCLDPQNKDMGALTTLGGVEGLARVLQVDPHQGLSSSDTGPTSVSARSAAFGENKLPETPPKTFLGLVWDNMHVSYFFVA